MEQRPGFLYVRKQISWMAVKHGLGGECKTESRDMVSNEIKLEKTQERRQFFKCIEERKAN